MAQIQLTVAIYAVIARHELRHDVEPDLVRTLAEKAWEHCHFLSQQEAYWPEDPELDELASRVAIALGNPSEEWLIIQARSQKVGPRGLWAMVDAYIEKDGYPKLTNELTSSIVARYRNIKGAEISTLRYLAKIWQRLEASEAVLQTAVTMMGFHQRAMERKDYVVVMSLLVLAARQRGATSRTRRDMRSLYEYLWAQLHARRGSRNKSKRRRDTSLVEEVAAEAGFSRFHCQRIFRGLTGESTAELVRRLRLEYAAHRLRHESVNVIDVALDAGYSSEEAFSRAFHRGCSVSPGRYRTAWPPPTFSSPSARVTYYPGENRVEIDLPTGGISMEVRIETLDDIEVARIRHVGPYEEIGPCFESLFEWAVNHVNHFVRCVNYSGRSDSLSI